MPGGAKKARSTGAPKSDRARLMARHHTLADRGLLQTLSASDTAELAAIGAELDLTYESSHLEMLDAIRRDREELRRSIDEIHALVKRTGAG